MKPIIIGQSYDDPSNIAVQVDQIDDIPIVKILYLKTDTVSEALTIGEVRRFMPCEDYTGAALLAEILEIHQLIL